VVIDPKWTGQQIAGLLSVISIEGYGYDKRGYFEDPTVAIGGT
jgi:hypothetical protein